MKYLILFSFIAFNNLAHGFSLFESEILSHNFYERAEVALKADFSFKINLTDNTATYYENGIPVDKWNVATGDVTGMFHGGEIQETPKGIYKVQRMVHCPKWSPGKVTDKETGEVITDKDARELFYEKHPNLYGACGEKNPLGNFVIWFQQPYGLHGNSNESVLERKSADSRRVSGGCVRNPNEKIREIFLGILEKSPSMKGFLGQIFEQDYSQEKRMIAYEAGHLDINVVIGEWETTSSNIVTRARRFESLENASAICKIRKSQTIGSRLPISLNMSEGIPSELDFVEVEEEKRGYFKTAYGWYPKELFYSCNSQKKLASNI